MSLQFNRTPDVIGRGARDRFLFKTPDFENKKGPANIKGWAEINGKNLAHETLSFSIVKSHLWVSRAGPRCGLVVRSEKASIGRASTTR